MQWSALFISLLSFSLSLSHHPCSFSPLLFIPMSTLDRCALVPTCVGRWNIKHVISLGSNKMGCQFSPGTRMKKFLHKLFQRESKREGAFYWPTVTPSSVPSFPLPCFLKDPLVFPLWWVKMCQTLLCKGTIGERNRPWSSDSERKTRRQKQRKLSTSMLNINKYFLFVR